MKSGCIWLAEDRLRQRPQEHRESHLRLPAYLNERVVRSGPTLPGFLRHWCRQVRRGGRLEHSQAREDAVATPTQCGGLLGQGCFSAAWAGTPSPPCVPMRRTWGPAGAV